MELEMVSIIQFVLQHAGNPAPYYWRVPAHFMIPAVYFPSPEIDTGGDTFHTYFVDYRWYIKLFHTTEQTAYALGYAVVLAIRAARNLIPLLAADGTAIPNSWVRVNDPALKVIEFNAAQLAISWRSRKPYNEKEAPLIQSFHFDTFAKQGPVLSDEEAAALEPYSRPLE